MKKLFLVISALSLLGGTMDAQKKEQKKEKLSKADKEFLDKQPDGLYAKIETNRGDIYAMLEYTKTPLTVANFVGLAEGKIKNNAKPEGTPYFNGLKFHRIIPGFMIQGGCPNGNGSGDPGYSFQDELLDPSSDLAKNGYKRGVLAMANRGPNTNGSQFFIMHQDYPLPYNYTIFGHVVKGIETVDSIISTPREPSDMPKVDQVIKSITILRKGKEAEAYDAAKTFETEKASFAAKQAERDKAILEAKKKEQELAAAAAAEALKAYEKTPTTASGLKYIIEKEGNGPNIKVGDKVSMHCSGYLLVGGTKFWSSHDGPGQPLDLTFGVSPRLIAGLEEGLVMLKQGGKAKYIIPSNIGYGEQGSPPAIPPNAWLIFDIEIVKVN